jgi:hypothetical protein
MRRLYPLIFGLTLAIPPAFAQNTPQIRQTIEQQFTAMAQGDFARAFSYASPNIQALFGTAQQFEMMVRQGYPMVIAPREMRLGPLRQVAGNWWQRVMVLDQMGQTHALDYMMVETPQGWQINAVQVLPDAPSPSV